jgi:hypothetical protein
MLIVLIAIARIGRRSDIPYIGVHLIVTSNGRYHVYTAKPSQVPIPGYCLRVYI